MSKPLFSIIMASTLAEYKGAASNREVKIVRAIESVIAQSFGLWELIIIADGCQKTIDIVSEKYDGDERIKCSVISKQPQWSGKPRNRGNDIAAGEYRVYLDNDDYFGTEHLKKIHDGLLFANYPNVVFFNDMIASKNSGELPAERNCRIQRGECGTSNIAFHKSVNAIWTDSTYLHDWVFIQSLRRYGIKQIHRCEYIVCHLIDPKKPLDV